MLGHRLIGQFRRHWQVAGTVRGDETSLSSHPAFLGARLFGGVRAEEPQSALAVIDAFQPEVIVNCIGIVKQRAEAADPIKAITVNSLFPHHIFAATRHLGVRLIHISTDCVFSGQLGRPYTEDDLEDARDVYGRSKLMGEPVGSGALTLRTSIIGWELGRPTGLLEWAAAQACSNILGYRGAYFSGFTTDHLAELIAFIIAERPSLSGLRHAAAEGIDKFDLLMRLNRILQLGLSITPVDEPRIDRRLDGGRLVAETGKAPPSWDSMLAELCHSPRYHSLIGQS
jgi:dTDP-4-dehydrorhamnose reductase